VVVVKMSWHWCEWDLIGGLDTTSLEAIGGHCRPLVSAGGQRGGRRRWRWRTWPRWKPLASAGGWDVNTKNWE
jgi:hypothetical protein